MRRIRHTIRRCNADRLEREAYARLLAAMFAEPAWTEEQVNSPSFGQAHFTPFEFVTDPSLLYSICRNVVEDPQRWN